MAKKRWWAYFYLIINVLCWGAALIIVKPSLSFVSPTRFLLYRFFFATILSLPILWYYAPKIKKLGKNLISITAHELIGTTVALLVLYTALSKTGAIEASMLGTTGPVFIVLAGIWMLHERQTRREWLGLSLAFGGSLLIALEPIWQHRGAWQLGTAAILGNALMILYNLINGVYFVSAKKHYHKLPKLFVVAVSFVVGLVTFALATIWEAQLPLAELWRSIGADFAHLEVWVASLYMASFGSVIGLTAYIKGQDGIEASEASLFTYLQPLVYMPLGVLLLGETVSQASLIALVLVFLGVWIAERRG